MKFAGLVKLTLLDYPEKMACTLFTAGCNLRCPFCHNALLVTQTQDAEEIDESEVLAFLEKRKGVLEGVCVTGGEPLLHKDLPNFLQKVKKLGYLVKLDTNGTFPDKMIELVESKLVDYVAVDVKNAPSLYDVTVGTKAPLNEIDRTVNYLLQNNVDYEFRTTVTHQFHNQQGFEEMGKWIRGANKLFLQMFVDSGNLIDSSITAPTKKDMLCYKKILSEYVKNVHLRGIEE